MKHESDEIKNFSIVKLLIIIGFIFGIFTMTKILLADETDTHDKSFAITARGDHHAGANGIGVWPLTGQIRIGISNALSSTLNNSYDGVGLLDANLSSDEIRIAKDIHDQLCHVSEEKPTTDLQIDPMIDYSVGCVRDGKAVNYQGRLGDLPKKLAFLVDDFYKNSIRKYTPDGRAIVKFDVIISDVQRQTNGFLVSVKFFNSGNYSIKMRTPDQWTKLGGDRLDVSGFRTDGYGEWRADLAGAPVVNKGEYSVDTITQPTGESGTFVTIPAGDSVTYKFLSAPAAKVPQGAYDFGAIVFASINVKGIFGIGGRVNFVSDRTKQAHVMINTDYPSTPKEWKDYEARQREKMSSHRFPPGAVVVESGHYRKVAVSGERGQFVVSLMRGERTPALDQPFSYWVWDADLTLPARCKPGEPCPRDGRWIARTMRIGSTDGDVVHPEFERDMDTGEIAPDLSSLGGMVPYHYWQWYGA
ncbi:hypothetical protein [Burkholderia sp. Ax-1719]|uniref:hypothetical protein n=1 Tax=Burkholderia sp. Ax-1719 TaxID=2608334 RepID=UPI001421589F|nr:hypothetical protein [Burkholderia sp. Ax-1719]NIE65695.1 hypothetical protein [Burkholderia sp. Ax-1719]